MRLCVDCVQNSHEYIHKRVNITRKTIILKVISVEAYLCEKCRNYTQIEKLLQITTSEIGFNVSFTSKKEK